MVRTGGLGDTEKFGQIADPHRAGPRGREGVEKSNPGGVREQCEPLSELLRARSVETERFRPRNLHGRRIPCIYRSRSILLLYRRSSMTVWGGVRDETNSDQHWRSDENTSE